MFGAKKEAKMNSTESVTEFNVTAADEQEGFPWAKGTDYLCLYGMVVTCLGFLLNYICFVTVGHMPSSNSAYLMRILAVWDSIGAMADGILHLGLRYFNVMIANFNATICKLFYFHSYGSSIACNYLMVALAMDRLVAIKFPFVHRNNSSIKVAMIIGSGCVCFAYFISLPVLYFFDLNDDELCVMLAQNVPTLLDYYSVISNHIFFFGLPFSLIVFANIFFIRELQHRKSAMRKSAGTTAGNDEQAKRKLRAEKSYIVMLMFLTGSFLVFSLSVAVFNLLGIQIALNDEYTQEQANFFAVMAENCMIMNNSLNFLFYFMSGEMFRTALKAAWKKGFIYSKG